MYIIQCHWDRFAHRTKIPVKTSFKMNLTSEHVCVPVVRTFTLVNCFVRCCHVGRGVDRCIIVRWQLDDRNDRLALRCTRFHILIVLQNTVFGMRKMNYALNFGLRSTVMQRSCTSLSHHALMTLEQSTEKLLFVARCQDLQNWATANFNIGLPCLDCTELN